MKKQRIDATRRAALNAGFKKLAVSRQARLAKARAKARARGKAFVANLRLTSATYAKDNAALRRGK